MLTIHAESHLDHNVGQQTVDYLLEKYKDRTAFFIETFVLPDHLPALECGLHGPLMGDGVIQDSECHLANRGTRTWDSRLCKRQTRMVRQVTVVAGPHDGQECILYTIYGGPSASQEPGDPGCKDVEKSKAFWAEHALSE